MTPRIRALVAAEPLVPPPFRSGKAPQIFREFVETLQRLHDSPSQPAQLAKSKSGSARTKLKVRRARKAAK
jgi:hypothetical protein